MIIKNRFRNNVSLVVSDSTAKLKNAFTLAEFFSPHSGSQRKIAFTLAEVLITLGIIGVVAAMTLPALIQNHRKGVVETALKKFYTTMNQAILQSVSENGETSYWSFPTSDSSNTVEEFYNKYFKKYLKSVKTGETNGFFTVYFADGSGVYSNYYGKDWFYCINAKDLKNFSNKQGTSCFRFGFYPTGLDVSSASYSYKNFYNKGIEPYVIAIARNEEGGFMTDEGGNNIYTTEDDLYEQKCYAKAIQLNGWKIPDDYPFKF